MAANMKAVKLRIKSVKSTMQITKAMELVASSKLRRAKERSENCRPYFRELFSTLKGIACGNNDVSSIYASVQPGRKVCYVVMAGDRGLAGGYNSNLFKCLEADASGREGYSVLPVGKKAVDYFRKRNVPILSESHSQIAGIGVSDCFEIAKILCDAYKSGEYGSIKLVYTEFVSMLSQQPHLLPVLPISDLDDEGEDEPIKNLILYEPDSISVFDAIVPEYVAGVIYGAVCDSVASEQAARRTAMESATSNAEEMIDTLNLSYNRARQASITQEITEIVGGAEGL
ncbi:MAG: ATP synthase F1 subunit gamma [Lachnospiraceae bacterium]|nr:ATP synthase F1 subunit gamma [Lachnospiraceae bacterium]